jgi:hypothetical protein
MPTTTSPAPAVACPICDAPAGQPCRTPWEGAVREARRPHLYRVQVAAEVRS